MRGQPFSSDSDERWRGIEAVSREIGIAIKPELVQQLDRGYFVPGVRLPGHHQAALLR